MQQRLQSHNSTGGAAQRGSLGAAVDATPRSQRGPASLPPGDHRDDFEDETLRAEEGAAHRNQRVNVYGNLGLSGPQSPAGGAGNAFHHATHSASNSLGNVVGLELGLSLGANVGTFSYQNRTGT